MANIFRQAIELREMQRHGQTLTEDELTTINAALIPVDKSFGDLPTDEALEYLAEFVEPPSDALVRKFWLIAAPGSTFPLTSCVHHRGQIAQLVKLPKKEYSCSFCRQAILNSEPHYMVFWSGAGLGDIKHPRRVHVACLPDILEEPELPVFLKKLWYVMFDYAHDNAAKMIEEGKLDGYVRAMQRVWTKMHEKEKEQSPEFCQKAVLV